MEQQGTDRKAEDSPKQKRQFINGTVTCFKREEGYGFVKAGNAEYYFTIHAVSGEDIPAVGDRVEGRVSVRPHKPNQKQSLDRVTIKKKAEKAVRNDRMICPHCGKEMVPRLVFYQGEAEKSVCPFCGRTIKDWSACFIATAVYGDAYAPEVIALRRMRDEKLVPNAAGRLFIRTYYAVSPGIARWLKNKTVLCSLIKVPLRKLAERFM
jgi:cold shock CspA family protein